MYQSNLTSALLLCYCVEKSMKALSSFIAPFNDNAVFKHTHKGHEFMAPKI